MTTRWSGPPSRERGRQLAAVWFSYRRGTAAAFRLGSDHGLFCLGCCWAIMLVMFAVGVAHLWWMAAFTAIMLTH